MPSRERVEAFIASVVAGDHVRAIADYYTEDASMQENLQPPRRGRAALMGHEAKVAIASPRRDSSTTPQRHGRSWTVRAFRTLIV